MEIAAVPTFRTYELYAEEKGVPILLDGGLIFNGTRWLPRPGVKIKLGELPSDGFGLAGIPGRWRDQYGEQDPTKYGHDARWGVMYMTDHRRRRAAVAVPVEMLRGLLGEDWRSLMD